MIGNKKLIGVCLTKINMSSHAYFADCLNKAANELDYKLIVFNSVKNFSNNDKNDAGAKSVYDIIDYKTIDALVVYADSFKSDTVLENIVSRAYKSGVPIVLIGADDERCICIKQDLKTAYTEIVRHVIKGHGITETYFVADDKDSDPLCSERLECYKQVLEENNLPFENNRIIHTSALSRPSEAADILLKSTGGKPALFCSDDDMAISVCRRLEKKGRHTPDDALVIGFGGTYSVSEYSTGLTGCEVDFDKLARTTLEVLKQRFENAPVQNEYRLNYRICISQSCCSITDGGVDKKYLSDILDILKESENHENYIYSVLDRMLLCESVEELSDEFAKALIPNSSVFLNSLLFTSQGAQNHTNITAKWGDVLLIPSAAEAGSLRNEKLDSAQSFREFEKWADENSAYIITSINAGTVNCGFYAVKAKSVVDCSHKINRIVKALNISLNALISRIRQAAMQLNIEKSRLINPSTGLPNIKGATKWFEEFSANPLSHSKFISVSVYALPKYKYIYENYGINEIEETVCFVSVMLEKAGGDEGYIAQIAEDEFVVVNICDTQEDIARAIDKTTSVFYAEVERYNSTSGKEFFVEVNAGCVIMEPGWQGTLANFTKLANNDMYKNRLKTGVAFAKKEESAPKDYYNAFEILVKENLFSYHFQPIVNAKNGEIYGYEALMRTAPNVGMSPLEVIHAATEFRRLYDIEKATMFNIMERFVSEIDSFRGRKVFINSIPGCALKDQDTILFKQKFSQYMENVVFEITESSTISDEELPHIKTLGLENGYNYLAIDDFGTGHSNIVNLLRYAPQIIKIDRFLITDIDKDVNKRMFVSSTVDFAKVNDIRVLAEGVETSDEMKTVINLGVDYIQGYYTGRPVSDPVSEIDPVIKQEIILANPPHLPKE